MKVGELCNHKVVTIRREDGILDAARRMREEHVGSLVIVEDDGGRQVPVGILTDRDKDGALEGILSFDDVVDALSDDVAELAALLTRQRSREVEPGL